ncbi:MAG TPA: DUF455 family protein [Planctomycetota bacterium]|nr:DUF455 family protein [Planctomycetota bacterium]
MNAYAAALLAAIAAPDAAAKDAILASIAAPDDGATWEMPALPPRPGRPPHWREAAGAQPRRRKTLKHEATRQRFLLAIHHIELSAIDLACVCALRGSGMPRDFHRDQLAVAREEATHAALLDALLSERGWPPGTEPVHHRLWQAAIACADLGEQLVVVPRFLEARGLDVGAAIAPRLATIDMEAHLVLTRIHRDEIGHVGIGTRWHRSWCAQRGLDAEAHFAAVVRARFADQLPGPFPLDRAGRDQAGFTAVELAALL